MLAALDARVRILCAVAFACTVAFLASPAALAGALGMAAALVALARLPMAEVARRMFAIEALIVVVVLSLPFSVAGKTWVSIGPLTASAEGGALALTILARVNAIGLAALALLGGIEALAFGHAMARLGMPEKLVQILFLAARYVDVLGRQRRRLSRAMAARAFRPRSNRHTWRSFGYFIGMLLVRSFERAERVLAAMKCRGYRGHWPAPAPDALGRRDVSFAGVWLAFLLVLVAMEVA